MDVAVDEAGQHGPAGQIDMANAAGRRAALRIAGSDRDDRSALGDQMAVRDMALAIDNPAIGIDDRFRLLSHSRRLVIGSCSWGATATSSECRSACAMTINWMTMIGTAARVISPIDVFGMIPRTT